MTALDLSLLVWLILCGMLILSRALFLYKGKFWLKRFLLVWLESRIRLIWGWGAVAAGAFILLVFFRAESTNNLLKLFMIGSVTFILIADGAINIILRRFAFIIRGMLDSPTEADQSTSISFVTQINSTLAVLAVGWYSFVVIYFQPAASDIFFAACGSVILILFFVGSTLIKMGGPNQPSAS